MGNSSTKEQRAHLPHPSSSQHDSSSHVNGSAEGGGGIYSSRQGRGSRDNLSLFLGRTVSGGGESDVSLEPRRETKVEREARKLERERIQREKDREWSMRVENIDGGYLITQGVYTGPEDYSKPVVRQLMIERRIAPFWRGLSDHADSWTEHQLVAAARGKPVPAADAIPPDSPQPSSIRPASPSNQSPSVRTNHAQTVPSISSSPPPSGGIKGRAKTLTSMTSSTSRAQQSDSTAREVKLPDDPYVNGQKIEAYLYKDAFECPICFLYYPPHLNKTRCCDQAICSECFVQIRRPDPHPPEHADPNAPPPPADEVQNNPEELVSGPSQCPYCAAPEFGVTYEPPPFRRGLIYTCQTSQGTATPPSGRRRAMSLAATDPSVITTDKVRPDWITKLVTARAHQARRSAAATALHTAAYLMGGRSDRRFMFGRRSSAARDSPSSSVGTPLDLYALMQAASQGSDQIQSSEQIAGPRQSSRGHRSRVDDLEDMMVMEAIRLSLAAEEDNRRKEEKEKAKEDKKKAKEAKKGEKKAEKAAKKGGMYSVSANPSMNTIASGVSGISDVSNGVGKGKGVARNSDTNLVGLGGSTSALDPNAQKHLERSRAQIMPSQHSPSHLRNLSNASSSNSSLLDTGIPSSFDPSPNASGLDVQGMSSTPLGGGAGLEPMFNFRSLAQMIDDEAVNTERVEGAAAGAEGGEASASAKEIPNGKAGSDDTVDMWKEDENQRVDREHGDSKKHPFSVMRGAQEYGSV